MEWGTVWGGKWEWGGKEEGGRGQSTNNLGPEWTGVPSGTGEDSSGRGGIIKGIRQGVIKVNVNPVYIVLLYVCRANKRIVFRL